MNFKKTTLANGLRVITVPFTNMESATVTVWTGVGSRFENEKNAGISHFLEHMVFKGSKKRPTAREIAESVDSIGGDFNAGTSKEYTNFYIKARNGQMDTAFDVLSDMVLNPALRQVDIEREKGVILEEIAMYEDTPSAHVADLFEQLIFKNSDLGRDIIGTRDSVKSITKADFVSYRDMYYFAKNMLVTVAGGVSEKEALKLVEKYFGAMPTNSSARQEINEFKANQMKPQVLLKNQKKEQGHLILGFLGDKRGGENRYIESVLVAILGGGMSSRLFTEVREKRGLAYSVRSSKENYEDCGYIETYAGVEIGKIDEAIKVMLDECYGLRDGKLLISEIELAKGKEYLKGHLALSLEDTRSINHFLGEEELILGRVRTPEEVYRAIDKVTVEDILRVAKTYFQPERLNLAIVGPYEDQSHFQKLLL